MRCIEVVSCQLSVASCCVDDDQDSCVTTLVAGAEWMQHRIYVTPAAVAPRRKHRHSATCRPRRRSSSQPVFLSGPGRRHKRKRRLRPLLAYGDVSIPRRLRPRLPRLLPRRSAIRSARPAARSATASLFATAPGRKHLVQPGLLAYRRGLVRQAGDTAGARVYAVADGEVVYAGANYPGRVVIVRHADDLYSMYGHLDPALAVRVGQQVARGDLIGTVLRRERHDA